MKQKKQTSRGIYKIEVDNEQKRFKMVDVKTLNFVPGVNVIIGPNGSGKSSLIKMIMQQEDQYQKLEREGLKLFVGGGGEQYPLISVDVEQLREMPHWVESQADMFRIGLRRKSHGESTRFAFGGLQTANDPTICLIDEPELALDMVGMAQLVTTLKASKALQILIATHHPLIILQPDFHVVELVKGYRESVRLFVRAMAGLEKGE